MKLNLAAKLLNIDGNPDMSTGKEQSLGQCIGRNLALQSSENFVNHAKWAKALYDTGEVELTMEEWVELKKFVQTIGIGNIYKMQIYQAFLDQEKQK